MTVEEISKLNDLELYFIGTTESRNINGHRKTVYNNPYEKSGFCYSDLSKLQQDSRDPLVYTWNLAAGSDYGGDAVTRSNYLALLDIAKESAEAIGKTPGECGVWTLTGGWDSYGILIAESCPLEAVWDAIKACEDYPLLDEELYAEVESEMQDSYFMDCILHRLKSYIEENLYYDVSVCSDSIMRRLFESTAESVNEYWVNEQGNSAYIDDKRVFAAITESQVKDLPGAKEIPE